MFVRVKRRWKMTMLVDVKRKMQKTEHDVWGVKRRWKWLYMMYVGVRLKIDNIDKTLCVKVQTKATTAVHETCWCENVCGNSTCRTSECQR